MNKKIFYFFSLLCLRIINIQADNSFEQAWNIAQQNYLQLRESLEALSYDETLYTGSYWLNTQKKFRSILLGQPNQNLLKEPIISHTMVRMGFSTTQSHEELHLAYCLSSKTKQLLNLFQETDFSHLPRECSTFNCSTSSLGHLFSATKTLESFTCNKQIETIVEFGGGYGCLARIYKMLIPEATIIILDLPEILAVQKLFLDITLPNVKTIMHYSQPTQLEPGAIHLIPMFFIEKLTVKADIFVSTFAISEAPQYTQQLVINQKFFNASVCYITGQLNGWGGLFENHNLVINNIQKQYPLALCQPYHIQMDTRKCYELLGIAQN